jgi:sialate O-acetylesterase
MKRTVLILLASFTVTHAELKLPAVIGSHMVLQQGQAVPIWGWAKAGQPVEVAFGGQVKKAKADASGKWMVQLDPMEASFEAGTLSVKAGGESATCEDVLVGEVWICSGQSNMAMSLSRVKDGKLEVAAANEPKLRLLLVGRNATMEQQADCEGAWAVCHPGNAGDITAVGYFFCRTLQRSLNVPVGLIHTAWGGTPSEAWTRREAIEKVDHLKPLLDRWDVQLEGERRGKVKELNEQRLTEWETKKAKAKTAGKPIPRKPRLQAKPSVSQHNPGNLYNGMIAPLIPFAVKGAIWYQGESNSTRAHQYRTLFPLMISNWRNDWGYDLSFHFVQLANFKEKNIDPVDSAWAELREAQTMALSLPKTGMAIITDIGMARDIHPKNKQDVGKRLARWALADDYGLDLVRSGPLYREAEIKGNKVVIHFTDIGGGLMAWDREELRGFAVAGQDQVFSWAKAKLVGKDTVEVWQEGVDNPVAVRYNWSDNPGGNLYNTAELPASSFRTDDWPLSTEGKH